MQEGNDPMGKEFVDRIMMYSNLNSLNIDGNSNIEHLDNTKWMNNLERVTEVWHNCSSCDCMCPEKNVVYLRKRYLCHQHCNFVLIYSLREYLKKDQICIGTCMNSLRVLKWYKCGSTAQTLRVKMNIHTTMLAHLLHHKHVIIHRLSHYLPFHMNVCICIRWMWYTIHLEGVFALFIMSLSFLIYHFLMGFWNEKKKE